MNPSRVAIVAVLGVAALAVWWFRSSVYGAGASPDARPRLTIVTGGSGPYWQIIGRGAQAAADDLDAEVQLLMPEQDENVDQQTRILSAIPVEGVDGVAVSPLDAEKQTRYINRLGEGAAVVTFDSDAPLSTRLCYVGASNTAAGAKCAALVKEALPDGGALAVLIANLTKDNMVERKRGFEEELTRARATDEAESAPKYEVVDYLLDEGDLKRAEQQVRDLLDAHDDLACLVGMNAQHGPLLLRVLEEEGRLGKIKLVTFDTEEETLEGVESGDIYATVAQDPYQYGYETVRLLASYAHRTGAQLPLPGLNSTLNVSTMPVKQENVAQFRKLASERLGAGAAP